MNIVTLQTFLAVVDAGNLVRASERLNVTQSTVTARLHTLENELGQTLLNRQKSGTTLTAAGQKLLRYAEVMTNLWRQARQETSLPEGMESICNLGCHPDLWQGPGRRLFDDINANRPSMALSALQGGHGDLDDWLGSGLVDLALTYKPTAHGNQTIHSLRADALILCSTRPDSPLRFDPGYVYVDLGEEYRDQHAEFYADASVTRLSFGSTAWALDFLLANGGTAYLPDRVAAPLLADGRLHLLGNAPVFLRKAYLVANDATAGKWAWLPDLIAKLSA